MALHPLHKALLARAKTLPDEITDWDAFRNSGGAVSKWIAGLLVEKQRPIQERHRVTIAVDGGSIDLLIYRPFGEGLHPVHVLIHGGGWVTGSIDDVWMESFARARCVEAHCVVVSVNYRKAPEHKFPTPLNDCYAALCWVRDQAQQLGVRLDRLTVGGQSAGANLAAALCLKVRDEGGPSIALQILEIPSLDLSFSLPSQTRHATGYLLTYADLLKYRGYYLRSSEDIENPYVSPLLAPDLTRLPPAHVMSAEYDPLCDDGSEYVKRLQAAGVAAQFSLQRDHTHISGSLTRISKSARAWQREVLDVLKRTNLKGAL